VRVVGRGPVGGRDALAVGHVAANGRGADGLVEVVVGQEHWLADGVVVEATAETFHRLLALPVTSHYPSDPLGGQRIRVVLSLNHHEPARPRVVGVQFQHCVPCCSRASKGVQHDVVGRRSYLNDSLDQRAGLGRVE